MLRRWFLCASLCGLSSAARAEVVMSFDASRCSSGAYQYYLTGNGMVGPYNQLLTAGHTVVTTSFLDAASLSGVSLFVTSQLSSSQTLAPSEAADLQAWVAAGGSCMVFGEGANFAAFQNQMGALFGGLMNGGSYSGSGVALSITAPSHPTVNGPAGVVASISGLNTPGWWTSVPASASIVATNPDGSAAFIALQYGSGRVVFTNDVNYFAYPPAYTADHARLWDNTIAWLLDTCAPPATFCTSSTSTHGCVASIGVAGSLSSAATSGCLVDVVDVEGQKTGLIFYGTSGSVSFPWAPGSTSFLCVKSPTQRIPAQSTGGTVNQCDGSLSVDFRAYLDASPGALGNPLTPGAKFQLQAWFRDPPAPKTTNLSNALELTACP